MKKILALILCAMLICVTPIVAFAEGESSDPVEQNTSVSAETEEPEKTLPEQIIGFITENYEGSSFLSLAITIVVYTFFAVKKHKSLTGTIGVLNNNAIKVATDSTNTISDVMAKAGEIAENSSQVMQDIVEVVKGYKEEFDLALAEIRKNAEEKQSLEATLLSVQKTLETLKMADLEFGNEVAELLVLANIPNAKKEELYSRHRAAVDAIATAENTEVNNNDGQET